MASTQMKSLREIEVKSSTSSDVRPKPSETMFNSPTQTSQTQEGSWNPFPGDTWTCAHPTTSSDPVTSTSSIFPGMLPAQTSPTASSNKPPAMFRRQKTANRPSGTTGLGCDADEQRMIDEYFATKKGPGPKAKVPQTHQTRVNANVRIFKPNVAPSHQNSPNDSAFRSINRSRRISVSENDFYKSKDTVANWMANQLSSGHLNTPENQGEVSQKAVAGSGRAAVKAFDTPEEHAADYAMYKQLEANRNSTQGYAGDATDEDIRDKNGDLRFDGPERSKKRRAEISRDAKRRRRN